MEPYFLIRLFALCLAVVNCKEKTEKTARTDIYSWTPPTEPCDSPEDETGMILASAETLLHYALTTAREVLDIQSKFMIGVIQQYQKIRNKNNITWNHRFENALMNSQSIIEYDQGDIKERLVGNAIGYTEPPDFTTNPMKPASLSNLIHNYNHLMIIIEEDKDLRDVDEEITTIRRLLDNAEAELHRFNFRVRKVMKRVARRLASSAATNNGTQTTPLFLSS